MARRRRLASGDHVESVSITDASTRHSEEMQGRMIKYAVAMGIRMVCLLLLFVVPGWWKLAPIIGAVFLPWFAVIIANGSDKMETHSDNLIGMPLQAAIPAQATREEPGPSSAGSGEESTSTDVVDGEDLSRTVIHGTIIDPKEGRP